MIPQKLKSGDEIRIIAPSNSMAILSKETKEIANQRFQSLGLHLSFGKNVMCCDAFSSSSIDERVQDLHDAFVDKKVKAIFTAIGGYNINQLLEYIDYDLIKANPKILCGYSDITALQNAIYTKTGLITYSGPHYSTFGMQYGLDQTIKYMKECLFNATPYEIIPSKEWSDDAWYLDQHHRDFMPNDGPWLIQEGQAEGIILGGNLCTFNLLQGTPYMPSLKNSVLFIEEDALVGKFTAVEFDRNLQSLIQQSTFSGVRGLMIGRFQKKSEITFELLSALIKNKKSLHSMPVIANIDFGHTDPIMTFPIGGYIKIIADKSSIRMMILEH